MRITFEDNLKSCEPTDRKEPFFRKMEHDWFKHNRKFMEKTFDKWQKKYKKHIDYINRFQSWGKELRAIALGEKIWSECQKNKKWKGTWRYTGQLVAIFLNKTLNTNLTYLNFYGEYYLAFTNQLSGKRFISNKRRKSEMKESK